MKQVSLIDLPFRIMPSRARNVCGPLAMIGIGAALLIAGTFDAIEPPEHLISLGMLLVGVVLTPIAILWFFRERLYFNPRSEYWIEIGTEEFALVNPDGFDRTRWAELSGFEVKKTTHRHDNKIGKIKIGEYETYTYEAVTQYGGSEILISLNDFATLLGNNDADRARVMCGILNELRQLALSGNGGKPFHVPPGLVVAPMPLPRKVPLAVKNSAVQRL